MRVLFVSSSRSPWYAKGTSAEEHFRNAPYSVDAIGYNLEKLGHAVAWLGAADTKNPLHLAREIDEFKPDVIYTYGSTSAVWPILLKHAFCRHRAFKVVHGWDDDYRKIWNEAFGLIGWWTMSFVQKLLVTRSDAVVTLSREFVKWGRKWGVDCHYIPNGADLIPRESIRGDIKLEGSFKIVYTGDKAKWKNTADVCRAMRELPADVKLYLTGRKEEYLEQYASDNCVFLGWLSKEEQYNVMSQADAFVVTSDQDCNAKLQEYMRWHKPILGFDGQLNNMFTNMKSAVLVQHDGYAEGIRKLAAEAEWRAELARNAEAEVPVYTWAEIARQFEEFFASLIERGNS